MENSLLPRRILGFLVGLAVMTSATLAFAHPAKRNHHPHRRSASNRVDTPLERLFDYDRNGRIGPGERWAMKRARVDQRKEYRCDFNRNGWVDTRAERVCL